MNQRDYPCEFCDTSESQVKKMVTVTRQRGDQWFIFEDVPAWICPNCGHRYFEADVLEIMESRMTTTPENARPITAWAISFTDKAS